MSLYQFSSIVVNSRPADIEGNTLHPWRNRGQQIMVYTVLGDEVDCFVESMKFLRFARLEQRMVIQCALCISSIHTTPTVERPFTLAADTAERFALSQPSACVLCFRPLLSCLAFSNTSVSAVQWGCESRCLHTS